MPQHKNCITAEMQAEDHYCLLLNKNTVCLWNTESGKETPKKHCNNNTYQTSYKNTWRASRKLSRKASLRLGTKKICKSVDCKWSLVERCITIKKKDCSSKDDHKPKVEIKYKYTLKKASRKGGQILINYYVDKQDIEGEEGIERI
eukprot:3337286-Ditylum_brightwellii.AAC.1